MKNHLLTIGKTDTWITPKYITDALGPFDLDPCAHTEMPWFHAKENFTIETDGLKNNWFGRVWLNPPFNRNTRGLFMQKMSVHRNGIMLIPASCETDWFKRYVFDANFSGICMMDHRPYFRLPSGEKGVTNSGQTICLVAYDEENLESLFDSKLGEVLSKSNKYKSA